MENPVAENVQYIPESPYLVPAKSRLGTITGRYLDVGNPEETFYVCSIFDRL